MPDTPGKELVPTSEAEAAVEPYRASGLIEAAIGSPERSMDRMIGDHLANVAMLEARGDKSPERPVYIFNPESRLLINYALRRDEDLAKSGLFAEVVELDESGKPRYGVSVVNPFATSTGFINVSVGDNPYGFAPSYTEMKLDNDDPLQTVPPNIETADLLAMLGQSAIPESETVMDFVARRSEEREAFRNKVRQQQQRHYLGTVQSFGEFTNPDMHLIISDRDDAELMAASSREVGLYPLVVSGDDVINHYRNVKRFLDAPEHLGESIPELLRRTHPDLFHWLGSNAVSFMTVDIADEKRWNDERRQITVSVPASRWSEAEGVHIKQVELERSLTILRFAEAIIERSPIFARLVNPMLHPEYNDSERGKVEKEAHGQYMQVPVGKSPDNLREYTDWLRKVRLDMALTLYLRGLNQL
ncbi:MAG TPA: hypothetical protein VH234_01870 [Candidatus Saccharimonadales bacterium]|jgi:hypothetical protein|nr:hypothetical protein [Candidatus Saccharimonadales bacterium]